MTKIRRAMRRFIRHAVGLSLVLTLTGCLPKDFDVKAAATPQNAAGVYVYRWNSGAVESIALHPDMTYKHSLFPSTDAFATGTTIHTSEGKWFATSKGHGALNQVHFTDYFSMFDDQQLERPVAGTLPFHEFTFLWNPFVETPRAVLQITDDPGYWFVREAESSTPAKKG